MLRSLHAGVRGDQVVEKRALRAALVVRLQRCAHERAHERPTIRRVLQEELRRGAILAHAQAQAHHATDDELRLRVLELGGD